MTTLANVRAKFGADVAAFEQGTRRMERGLAGVRQESRRTAAGIRSFNPSVATLGSSLHTLATTAVAVAGSFGLAAIVKSATNAADAMDEMAEQTGLSVEWLSGLRHTTQLAGTDMNTLSRAVITLRRNAELAKDGSTTLAAAFGELGLKIDEFVKLNPDEQLRAFAEGLHQAQDPGRQLLLLTQLMGTRAAKLAPIFTKGAEGLARFQAEAAAANQVLTREQVDAGVRAADAMENLELRVKGIADQLVLRYVPALTEAVQWLDQFTRSANAAAAVEMLPDWARFLVRGTQAAGNLIGGYAAATLHAGSYQDASAMLADVRAESGRILRDDVSAGAARRGDPNRAELEAVEQLRRLNERLQTMEGTLRRNGMAVAQ